MTVPQKKVLSALVCSFCFFLFPDEINLDNEADSSVSTDSVEVIESPENFENSEQSYLNSQNKFRLLEYDGEVLDITFNADGGIRTKVLAEGSRVVIKTFDILMRVIETAVFSQEGSKNLLTQKLTFLYEEKSQYPAESTEIDYKNNEKTEYQYNQNGYVVSKKHYSGKYSLSASQISEDVLLFQEQFMYDESNRIKEHVKKTGEQETRIVYFYEKELEKPDTMLYRNSVLREELRYSDDQTYSKTTYFDDDQSVTVLFENGIKKEEVFKQGLKILRRTAF